MFKALSIKQPWLNKIISGEKTIETRKWNTNYRGDLLLCSSRSPAIEPYGKALCIAELYDVQVMTKEHEAAACTKVYDKAHSWFLRNIRLIEPIDIKGKLLIFDLPITDNEIKFI